MRNAAIVAHVDQGKTTLVDQVLLAASSGSSSGGSCCSDMSSSTLNRLLNAGDLEKERGITITSKVTRLVVSRIDGLFNGRFIRVASNELPV